MSNPRGGAWHFGQIWWNIPINRVKIKPRDRSLCRIPNHWTGENVRSVSIILIVTLLEEIRLNLETSCVRSGRDCDCCYVSHPGTVHLYGERDRHHPRSAEGQDGDHPRLWLCRRWEESDRWSELCRRTSRYFCYWVFRTLIVSVLSSIRRYLDWALYFFIIATCEGSRMIFVSVWAVHS